MDVAMTSATVAKHIGFPYPDEAYTLGLFHNCGIPLLMGRFKNYPQVQAESYAREDSCITATENELISTNHAVVGYYVGKSWNLPRYLCEAIHEHHQVDLTFSDDRAEPKKKTLLAILKMAEHICASYKTLGKQERDYEWERIGDTILIYAGLTRYDFETITAIISELGLGNTDYCEME